MQPPTPRVPADPSDVPGCRAAELAYLERLLDVIGAQCAIIGRRILGPRRRAA